MKPKTNEDSNVEEVFTLDLPQRNMKEGLFTLFLREYATLANVLAAVTNVTDPRIRFLTDLIIATVPDDDLRQELKNKTKTLLEAKITEFKKNNGGTIENKDKAELLRDVCMEIIGEVTSFLDMHIGLTHKLEVRYEGDNI